LVSAGWAVHAAFGHSGDYINEYERGGCQTSIVPHRHWLHRSGVHRRSRWLLRALPVTAHFRRLVREVRPDIVYINTIVGPEVAVAARMARVPVVWHIRDMFQDLGGDVSGLPLVGKRGVGWLIKRLSSHVVCVSKATAENVLGRSTRAKASVVYNGVGSEFYCSPNRDKQQHDVIIGVPGTLRRMKGQDFLLRGLAKAAPSVGRFEVRITGVGDAVYRSELEKLANVPALRDRVRFLGGVSDMPGFLRECDLAVVPSSCDPLPRTVMEAMASGLPVVGTAVGGIPEMIKGGSGILVPYGDEPALAAAITRLVRDRGLRVSLGRAAATRARSLFTEEGYCAAISEILDDVLSQSHACVGS
jgi:glycosyltransferase involved in cell wall biosynthesis